MARARKRKANAASPERSLELASVFIHKGARASGWRAQRYFNDAGEQIQQYWEAREQGVDEPDRGDARARELGEELSDAWEKHESEEQTSRAVHADDYNPAPRRSRKPKNNPGVAGTLLVVGAAAVVTVGVILGGRYLMRRRTPSKLPTPATPTPTPEHKFWWQRDLDAQMPATSEFPMGWTIYDVGYYDDGTGADYRFAWRILRLNEPSTRCDPPCEFIVVTAGAGHGRKIDGWQAAATHEDAIRTLTARHEEVADGQAPQA